MIKPLGDRVVVKPTERTEKIGHVIIPENITEKPKTGTVLAIGEGNVNQDGTRTAPVVEAGAEVIFSQYAGIDFELDGAHFLILREPDLLGVIEPEPE